jgi:hypothetical protein
MAPVYDLAALLGYQPVTGPRWMVLAAGPQPVGFAFETFEAHLRASEAALVGEEQHDAGSRAARQHVRGAVRVAGELRPIIHMPSVAEMIGRMTHD